MIPYNIKFIFENNESLLSFQSNEKPVKGDIFTIQEKGNKLSEVKITEVTRVVINQEKADAMLEYRCKVQKHDEAKTVIGFGKRD
jgi:hypothetical protein